jgi:putative membrane protein
MDYENNRGGSVSDVLAKERTREAAERTLLAWVRTSLSLISFGFGIYKIVQALSGDMPHHHPMTVLLGLCFIVLGIFSMIAATAQHIQILGTLQLDHDSYKPKRPLGVYVAIALSLIGLFAFITVIVEFFVLGR